MECECGNMVSVCTILGEDADCEFFEIVRFDCPACGFSFTSSVPNDDLQPADFKL